MAGVRGGSTHEPSNKTNRGATATPAIRGGSTHPPKPTVKVVRQPGTAHKQG